MKYLDLENGMHVSQLAFGCMRISDMSVVDLTELVKEALKEGVNFFDHADIYGGGKSEKLFGEVLKQNPELRKEMIIQSKCGIRRGEHVGYFDFSKEHIINSVNQSIERMNCEYLDVLVLHRPDTLSDPKEIAQAFDELEAAGKVKAFGVSNMNPMQMQLLQSACKQKLLFNQLQLSPVHSLMMTQGLFTNMKEHQSVDHDGSILDYCRLHGITIQPWSIMQASWEEGTFLNNPDYAKLNETLDVYAKKYGVTKSAVVIAWFLRHPANFQPIFGTTKVNHLREMCQGAKVELSREEWYHIYIDAIGHALP